MIITQGLCQAGRRKYQNIKSIYWTVFLISSFTLTGFHPHTIVITSYMVFFFDLLIFLYSQIIHLIYYSDFIQ